MVTAVDFGGTKTAFSVWSNESGVLRQTHGRKLPSAGIESPAQALKNFLQCTGIRLTEIDAVCMCFAGPVEGERCRVTNLDRTFDLACIRRELSGVPKVIFVNDLVALSESISYLDDNQVTELIGSPEKAGNGTVAVLAPGTGLGQGFVLPGGAVCPSEGSHADFAATSERQWRLRRYLAARLGGRVSWDRVLSGSGLLGIWRFLCAEEGRESGISRPEEVTQAALDGDALAHETMLLFSEILGAEAGNMALRTLSFGGVYIGGGIAPHLISWLKSPAFSQAYYDKGRFRSFLTKIPVYAVTYADAPSLGAAVIAERGI